MRVAVLGCGSIGRRHARNLVSLGVDTIAYDPLGLARERLAAESPTVLCHGELDAVWASRPDAVIVGTPPDSHVPLALEAARRGAHIMVEKPLSFSLDGVDKLEAEVTARGLVHMVACNMRFHPGPASVKRTLASGVLGQIVYARVQTGSYLPRWRPEQDHRASYSASPRMGGALLDCIHEIDLALWYFGPAKLVASAVRPAKQIGVAADGLAEMILQHEGGTLSSVHLNFIQRDYRRSCQIVGTEGSLYWDFGTAAIARYGPDGTLVDREAHPADLQINDMYVAQLRHFLECVSTGSPTMNPIAGGRDALAIALEARQGGGIRP